MKPAPTADPPPGRLLRWIAEHIASKAARERVLLPLLADLQFEHAEARSPWARGMVSIRGALAFWRALVVTATSDSAHHLWTNAWGATAEEARTTKLLSAWAGITTVLCSLLLVLDEWPRLARLPASTLMTLLPSMVVVALPMGLLVSFSLNADRGSIFAHRRAAVSVAVLAALVTFAIAACLTPVSNQAHRETVMKSLAPEFVGPLTKGDREMSLDELTVRASELRSAGQGEKASRFDLEWHKKFVLGAFCLALALSGAAIASTLRRRLWRFVAAHAVLIVVYALLRVGEQAADAGRLAPVLAMWGPFLLIAAVSLAVLTVSRRGLVAAPSGR